MQVHRHGQNFNVDNGVSGSNRILPWVCSPNYSQSNTGSVGESVYGLWSEDPKYHTNGHIYTDRNSSEKYDSGRSGEETRPINFSIKLWKRVS